MFLIVSSCFYMTLLIKVVHNVLCTYAKDRLRTKNVLLKVAVLPIFILVCLMLFWISGLELFLESISTKIFFTLGHGYTVVLNL